MVTNTTSLATMAMPTKVVILMVTLVCSKDILIKDVSPILVQDVQVIRGEQAICMEPEPLDTRLLIPVANWNQPTPE